MQYTENFFRCEIESFIVLAQNIDCGSKHRLCRGGSNEYPQSMFWTKNKNKKKWHTPVYPSFTKYKSGVKRGILYMDMMAGKNSGLLQSQRMAYS